MSMRLLARILTERTTAALSYEGAALHFLLPQWAEKLRVTFPQHGHGQIPARTFLPPSPADRGRLSKRLKQMIKSPRHPRRNVLRSPR